MDPTLPRLRVRAEVVEDLGAETHVIFAVDAPRVVSDAVRVRGRGGTERGPDRRRHASAVHRRHRRGASSRPGRSSTLAVDPARFHFFDPATGAVLGRAARAPAAV